jgi:hypothetical protein
MHIASPDAKTARPNVAPRSLALIQAIVRIEFTGSRIFAVSWVATRAVQAVGNVVIALERILQRKLDVSPFTRVIDTSKVRIRQRSDWVSKDRVVQSVEHFETELNALLHINRERFV